MMIITPDKPNPMASAVAITRNLGVRPLSLSNAPDLDLLGRVAGALAVDEAFVEKDWHVAWHSPAKKRFQASSRPRPQQIACRQSLSDIDGA